ncbi:hypothetical protein GCM10011504_39720 [Siccirubricoccus deserti]|nr:hypothetical protein GCM10011504_39720 [Siccirubricoccus deserti]
MDTDATPRALFGMVARGELTAAQAQTLIATIRATRPAPPPALDQVAIIGMAGRFPGADTPDAFWHLLANGRSAVSPQPPARWAQGPRNGAPAIAGGWLEGIEDFDHAFFGIPRREAEVMDPQQSLFLEAAWSALEQAGYAERDMSGRSVGVFVGAGAGDYASHLMAKGAEPDGLSFMGNSNAILAGRIAYLLNLRGPCLTVDTACSSSLTAVHLAREALLSGGCEMAIAGGVCVLPTPTFAVAASRAGMLSPSGTCRAFDAAADGFVPGEAVAALVLKPLVRALADGDHVWGVIEGSAANQDGRTNGITAPSAPAQAALIQAVHERFGIAPATIGYVEAHGTGTRLGDPIEVEALTRSFRRHTAETGFCAIGSVKSAVGHTMSAAGAVGIVKLLLSLAHRQLPPTLHVATPNPACEFETSPFFVNTALRAWEPRGGTRRAAISAFGFSGSNVHMVIAEAPPRAAPAASRRPRLLLLSARDAVALRATAAALAGHVAGQATLDLDNLCWTLAAGRNHYRERAALLVETAEDVVRAAQAVAAGQAPVAAGADAALARLAQRFLAGEDPDPEALVPPEGRRRIPLPGYPFRRVPCGLRAATRPRVLRGLHPLLDRVLPNGAFHTAIDPAEPLLADHLVQGAPILPGACVIGMALAAARAATGRAATGLSAVSFRAPVGVTEAAGLLLRLEEGRFTLCAEAGQGDPLATGTLGWEAPPAVAALDLAAIRTRLPVLLEGDALAARFATAGVALGPLFRGLRRIWLAGDPRQGEALAELSLPGEELAGIDDYDLHPTLLDGAFQAGMAALAAARPEAREVLVPAGLGALTLHARPEPSCLVHIVFAGAELVADRARFHASLLDETGQVLATARDFLALRLPGVAAQPAPLPEPNAMPVPDPVPGPGAEPVPVFVPRWHPTEAAPAAAPRPDGVVLILRDDEDGGLGDALAKALGDRGVIQVVLGEATESRAAGVFGIDRAEGVAFDRLLAQLKPLAAVYMLGSGRRTGAAAAALEAAARADLLPRMRFLQALAGSVATLEAGLPVRVVTIGAQVVTEADLPDAGAAMLAGLAMAGARELAPVRLSVVDLAPAELAADAATLATALLAEPDEAPGRSIALRGGGRWLRSLDEVAPSAAPGKAGFRDGGAYVLLGGTGGLGLALALHLARRHRARLLLVGRSPLSASQTRAVAEIEAAGGSVLHVRADAADAAQLDAALTEGRARFGRFDGAVQAAMVLRDTPFMQLDATAMAAVLAPKLAATANLARAIAADRPDLLVLFSSANAFIGNPGQGNYAAAAAGQDALGLALRAAGMPVVVVNWGYWGDVGAVAAPVFQKRAASLGIGAIGVAEGLAALEGILDAGLPQAMAMKVSAETLNALGIPANPAASPAAAPPAQVTEAEASVARLTAEFDALERCAHERLVGLFQAAGFLQAPGQSATLTELRRMLAVVPLHERLFDAVLDILCRAGFLVLRGDRFEVTEALLDAGLAERIEHPELAEAALKAQAPWLGPFLAVTHRCLSAYAEALAGRVAPTELLFPGGSGALVAPLYRDNPIANYFNAAVAAAVLEIARQSGAGRVLQLTEVGAGTGGTAIAVMQALQDAGIGFRYRFTDLSPSLIRAARTGLRARFPQAEFAVLDLEKPVPAGLTGTADIVIAVNVLHATADIGVTLAHCRALLGAGGTLLLNEAVRRRDFATLVFGLTEGWWRFHDAERRLPHSPLLDEPGWRAMLAEAGFAAVVSRTAEQAGAEAAQVVLLAQLPASAAAQPAPALQTALPTPRPAPLAAATAKAAEAPLTVVRAAVRRALAEALREPLDSLDDRQEFAALGIDSILGVDLTERLSARLGIPVPVAALFDYPTPVALAAHLAAEHGAALQPQAPPAVAMAAVPIAPATDTAVPQAALSAGGDAVAVVGMAGIWPGAPDLDSFWRNLRDGVSSIGLPPAGRWPNAPAGTESWRQGGFLDSVDRFDPLFFEMSGIEADHTDPQARLFLTTAWRALEHAGYGPAWLDGRRCGIFVGVAAGDYPSGATPGAPPPPHAFTGNAQSVLAGRLAYLLNLRGPALAVDTACSSSLVALHLACRSIASGESELALAAGVFVTSTPAFHQLTGSLGMTSPNGATRAFDDAADGFVAAEGVGVLVLRRLDAALADGDPVLGVVRATGTNQDGRTHGFTAPSSRAQAELVAEVLDRAGLTAAAIDYVEAHGTGTKLGDPIEAEALGRVFRKHGVTAPGACRIGSVKTNIGHTGPAAGIAGVQKVLLGLAHGLLPASLHHSVPNRHIDFAASPLAVCTRAEPWPRRPDRPRRAGVSAFGLSGTNAHVVLEEAACLPARPRLPQGPFLFPLSGRTEAALARRLADLAAWLEAAGQDVPLADIAHTLAIGRRHMAHRHAVLASDHAGLRLALLRPSAAATASADSVLVDSASALAAAHAALLAGRSDASALATLGSAYRQGADVDWLALYAGTGLRRVALPAYPFAEERHWAPDAALPVPQPQPQPIRFHVSVWQAAPASPGTLPSAALVFDDDPGLAEALGGRMPLTRHDFATLDDVALAAPLLVLHPMPESDPMALARLLVRLARRLLVAPATRVLLVARGDTLATEVMAAATALGIALKPQHWSVLRLSRTVDAPAVAQAVLAEAGRAGSSAELRWVGDERQERRLRPWTAAAQQGALPSGAVCWIVGGTGAIGQALAVHLRARHGAEVVLAARHAGPGVWPLDVTDAAAVERMAAEIRAGHGRLDAVFQLAGAMRAAPLGDATAAATEAVLASKIAGTIHLDRATAADRLSAFVLFSSLAAELGDFGQGDYALANRFLAGFAARRAAEVAAGRRHGRSLSIAWPVWQFGGMAAAGPAREAALQASGLAALTNDAGLAALDQLLAGGEGHVAVLPVGGPDPVMAPVAVRAVPAAGGAASGTAARQAVRALLAEQLRIPAGDIADDAPFGTLGLDSLHLRGFATVLEERFSVPMPVTELFRVNTVQALAEHLLASGAGFGAAPAAPAVLPSAAAPLPLRSALPASDGRIAIIGMAGRFPGCADLDAFWQALRDGRDLVGEIPPDRWDWRAYRTAPGMGPDTEVPRWGGFVAGSDRFDAAFFGITARDAAFLDPQARLLMQTAWHALEDAALPPASLAGSATGVFVGSQLNDYAELLGDAGEAAAQAVLGNTRTMLANRLSFLLDLHGPSQTIDTACSSSLVALHRAVRALREGECGTALVGGVHLILSPRAQVMGAQLGILSPTGRCRSFAAEADGYVRGEGVGVLVLKPLAQALADGDPVRAVILESGENHGGRASGLTTPNPTAQSALIAGVLRRAGVAVGSIGHIEAHGTGTALGDPVEVDALCRAFAEVAAERGEALPEAGFCGLSSVKSNIGHLEPASGIAGVIKSVLALQHATLPATLHAEAPNPLLPLAGSPFRLQRRIAPWPAPMGGAPRRGAVSSFGLGGSNAHLLLEEWPVAPRPAPAATGPALVPLSARDMVALRRQAEALLGWLQAAGDAWAWPDLLLTLREGRNAMPARLALVAGSPTELAGRLRAWLDGAEADGASGVVQRDILGGLFETADEAAGLVGRAVAQGRLDRVARLWVSGVPVAWGLLPLPPGARRRSLPGYAFADERHWFDQRPGWVPAPATAASPPSAAPMLPAPMPPQVAEPVAGPAPKPAMDADAVLARLLGIVADALYLDAGALDLDANLVELGVDSILAVEIARKLQDGFSIALPATRLYDAPTIRRLAALVADSSAPAMPAPASVAPAPTDTPSPVPIAKGAAAVPDDQVLRRLSVLLAEALYLAPEQIEPDQPFAELGLDSILAIELTRTIKAEFGVTLRATRLYDQPTPRGLAAAIAVELAAGEVAPAEPNQPSATPQRAESAVLDRLRLRLGTLLSLEAAEIEPELSPVEFGLDQVVAAQLLRDIQADFGVTLEAAALFRADTLLQLARQIEAARVPAAPAGTGFAGAEPVAPQPAGSGAYADGAIAVIGMAGRFPGAPDLDQFWRNLRDGVDSVAPVPASRFPIDAWYDPDPQASNRSYCRDGGFLSGIEDFDPRFFGIAPAEARIMDPQQRLFLETAWLALEDAGLPDHMLDGAPCAVFVGCSQGDYAHRAATRLSAQFGMGNVGSILAARIAYHLNLRGPAVAVDTACSSSLVAVHLACQALRTGECEMAVAGGVALMTTPNMHVLTSHARMLSPVGRCKAFDASADGFVPAEGVGAVVLKPLRRALADGDRVHGVIEGSGINQDGRSNGLTAPSLAAQRELTLTVWERFGIHPASIGHAEAHGTGTALGDPIEVQALTDAFRRHSDLVGECALSSVKTNIGHAVPAAGIAGLLKTLLLLRHRTLVPSLHLNTPNPLIDFANSPFHVPRVAMPWPARQDGAPRRGTVNAFGFSGTNAHAVVAEAPPTPPAAGAAAGPQLFLISAKTPEALRQRAAGLARWLGQEAVPLADLAYTLAAGRSHFRCRAAIVAADAAALRDALQDIASGEAPGEAPGEAGPAPAEAEALAALAAAADPSAREVALGLLARAYRAGAALRGLYPRGSGRLLSLPAYPFQRQRCWVEDSAGPPAAEPAPAVAIAISSAPLPTDGETRARPVYRVAASDALLAQHLVNGRTLLPAAASLAMLFEVTGAAGIAAIRWLRPVLAGPDGVELRYDADAMALVADGARYVTAQALEGRPAPPPLNLETIRARCPEAVPPARLYAGLAALGITYGPAFRCVTGLWRGPDGSELLADLTPPAMPDPGPFLLDAALHSIAALGDDTGGLAEAPLPSALEHAARHGALAQARYAWVRRRPGAAAFDVLLANAAGHPVFSLEGFAAQVPLAPKSRLPTPDPAMAAKGLNFYVPGWELAPLPAASVRRPELILANEGMEALAAALAALPGDAPARIEALPESGWQDALVALPGQAHVVLLGGRRTTTADTVEAMRALQALMALGRPLRVTVVAGDASDAGTARNWRGAALLGLAKVALREAPWLDIAMLDTTTGDMAPDGALAPAIMAEPPQRIGRHEVPQDVAWHAGARWQRQLVATEVPPHPSAIRRQGVYVLVGGAGGIGAAVARRLASQFAARLVLVGRRVAGSEQEALCAELAALGGQAVYEAADCADVAAMQCVRDRALARFGVVHGVMHAAFVMADVALPGMTEAELRKALSPKADGTAVLAEVFGPLPLDFLALFSSTNSATANAGQANYVAASMAQDAAGAWFGRGATTGRLPVRTINWGFWDTVGRVADDSFRPRLRGTGVGGIGTEEGVDALLAILAAGLPAVSVLRLEAQGVTLSPRPAAATDLAGLEAVVHQTLTEVLQLDPGEIGGDSLMAEIGLDSIGMVDVQARLEAALGSVPREALMGAQTVRDLVAGLAALAAAAPTPAETGAGAAPAIGLRAVQADGAGAPGFWVPSFIGETGWVRQLATACAGQRPTWLLEPGGLLAAGETLAGIGAAMAKAVREACPVGPVVLGGYSYGGVLAFETAACLAAQGVTVERVVLLDSFAPGSAALASVLEVGEAPGLPSSVAGALAQGWKPAGPLPPAPADLPEAALLSWLADAIAGLCAEAPPMADVVALLRDNLGAIRRLRAELRNHDPNPAGRNLPVTLLRAARAPVAGLGGAPLDPAALAAFRVDGPADHGWSRWLAKPPQLLMAEADHFGMGGPAVLRQVAVELASPPVEAKAVDPRAAAALAVVRRHTVAVLDGVAEEAVTLDVSLRDLGANSIDRVEIATLAMQELNADIPRPRLAGISTLASLVALLVEFAVPA